MNRKQTIQEEENKLPYHYSDLLSDFGLLLADIPKKARFETIKKYLRLCAGQSILDAGCGDGRFCYEMRHCQVKITGVDRSERAIAYARAFNPEADFVVSNLTELNLQRKFDRIVLMETLEHVPPEEIAATLEKLRGHLVPQGRLIVSVPSTRLRLAAKHYQHFTKDSLNKVLSSYFKIKTIIGCDSCSWERKVFQLIWIMGYLLFPLRKNIPGVKPLLKLIKNFYQARLAGGDPDDSYSLIAVCRL